MLKYQSVYYSLFAILFILAFLLTIYFAKKQGTKEVDDSASRTTVRHKVFGNIGMMQYIIAFLVLFSVLMYGILYYL